MTSPESVHERMTVPARYLGVAASLLARRGMDPAPVLGAIGPDPTVCDDPSARVDIADIARLALRYPELADDLELAFELGRATKPTAHGTLGYALLTSASLRQAVLLAQRFLRWRIRILHLRFYVEHGQAVLDFEETIPFGAYRPFVLAWAAGVVLCVGEFLLGDVLDAEAVTVRLTMDEPRQAHVLRAFLPHLAFGERINQVRFPEAWLDHPLPLSDEGAARAALLDLERELALFGEADVDVVARVRALFEDKTFAFGDLQAAAERLGVSTRTLRRHLQRHGTSYQELLAEARKARAIARLRDRAVSLDQLALELGYSDQANFSRAFVKWTGTTPGAFRKG